jgi:hypothetical protein
MIHPVLHVERVGAGPLGLVVEVPHGADRRAHYDAVRERLIGEMPSDLHTFFHINTDVGAWQLGLHVAEEVAARASVSAVAIRCLLPRTFIDCNRQEEAAAGDGLTAGLAPWIRHPEDRMLLIDAHRAYVAAVATEIAALPAEGFLLLPHSYGPRSMNIPVVGDDIVARLREQTAPENWASLPLRPPIDLITRTPEGAEAAPPGIVDELVAGWAAQGVEAAVARTYTLHPVTMGARWALERPGRSLCFEVRRDLLVERWDPFEEMEVVPGAVSRLAEPLVHAIVARMSR